MNEEEKKVIENIKHIIKHWQPPKEDKLATIEYESIKKLYEMYKQQQKEIEELKLMISKNKGKELFKKYSKDIKQLLEE